MDDATHLCLFNLTSGRQEGVRVYLGWLFEWLRECTILTVTPPPQVVHEDILDPVLLDPFVQGIKVPTILEASKIEGDVVPARVLLSRPPMVIVVERDGADITPALCNISTKHSRLA